MSDISSEIISIRFKDIGDLFSILIDESCDISLKELMVLLCIMSIKKNLLLNN